MWEVCALETSLAYNYRDSGLFPTNTNIIIIIIIVIFLPTFLANAINPSMDKCTCTLSHFFSFSVLLILSFYNLLVRLHSQLFVVWSRSDLDILHKLCINIFELSPSGGMSSIKFLLIHVSYCQCHSIYNSNHFGRYIWCFRPTSTSVQKMSFKFCAIPISFSNMNIFLLENSLICCSKKLKMLQYFKNSIKIVLL